MNLSTREKWICALLPMLLVFTVYSWKWSGPASKKLNGIIAQQEELNQLPSPEPERQLLAAEKRRLERMIASARVSSDESDHAANGESIAPLPQHRAATLQEVSVLCQAAGMRLVSSQSESQSELPNALLPIGRLVAGSGRASGPQLWSLELSGTYERMRIFLDSLGRTNHFVVPVRVSMQADDPESSLLHWRLTIWI